MLTEKAKKAISVTHPELAKEASGWDPRLVTSGSKKVLKWQCRSNSKHIWEVSPNSRTSKGITGCPFCSNQKILKGDNDLATTHSKIAREAYGWDPSTISAGSSRKMQWQCKTNKKHIWTLGVSDRTGKNTKCPFCSNQKILKGDNDLATTHPKLSKEAYGWDPNSIGAGSGRKLKWKCASNKEHIWETTPQARTGDRKTGCPYCSNRRVLVGENDISTTHPKLAREADGWDPTKVNGGSHKSLPWKCSKNPEHRWKTSPNLRTFKKTNCPFCVNLKILPGENDLATTHPLIAREAHGWDPTIVVAGSNKSFEWQCKKNPKHRWKNSIARRALMGAGCPYCINRAILKGENDLATTHPELAIEADGWDPTKVGGGSHVTLKWKCKVNINHRWSVKPNSRTSMKTGCPYCAGRKILKGDNDLATTHPDIAKEANGWDSTKVGAGSHQKRSWKCAMDSKHIWNAAPHARTGGSKTGCPKCAESGFNPGKKGYLYFLKHSQWKMLQIGISNVPNQRLAKHKKNGWELIEIRGPMDGQLTNDWETSILRMLKAKGADLSNSEIAGRFDGYSEAWSKSTFEVNSILELMRLTEEFEEIS